MLQTRGNHARQYFEKVPNTLLIHISQEAAVANINRQQWQPQHEPAFGRAALRLVRNIRSTGKDEVTGQMKSSHEKIKKVPFFNLKNYSHLTCTTNMN